MIDKFLKIQNVGRLQARNCSRLQFGNPTLVYAENGLGKTMLSAILRSLRSGEEGFILERKTLWTEDEPEVELRVDGKNVTFSNGAWSEHCPNIEVFDSRFVEDNVYSGSRVELEHKRRLCELVVGEQGVKLAKEVEELAEKISANNAARRHAEASLKPHIQSGLTPEQFCGLSPPDDLEAKLAQNERTMQALKDSQRIQTKEELAQLQLPSLPVDALKRILARTVEGVSGDAATKIKEHIAACCESGDETWFRQGVAYLKGNTCPFCGQDTSGVALVEAYRAHFTQALRTLSEETDRVGRDLEELLSERALLKVNSVVAANENQAEFWREYADCQFPELDAEKLDSVWHGCLAEFKSALEHKVAHLVDAIPVPEALENSVRHYEELVSRVASYNGLVRSANERMRGLKAAVRGGDVGRAKDEQRRLADYQVRSRPEVHGLCDELASIIKDKDDLTNQKETAKTRLLALTTHVFSRFQDSINMYLSRFGAVFSIARVEGNFIGGKPSSGYCIVIENKDVPLAAPKGDKPRPFFGNTLSSGDRSTLAFAFFLARLDQCNSLADRIIVLDDPISSLDSHRCACTKDEVLELASGAQQVLLLSHDALFLNSVWKGARRLDKLSPSALKISRLGDCDSTLADWDITSAIQEQYLRECRTLQSFRHGGREDPDQVARCIRPVLEHNLRARFPTELGEQEGLGKMIVCIRQADASSCLAALQPRLSDIERLDAYAAPEHHDDRLRRAQPARNETELRTYVSTALDFLGGVSTIASGTGNL